MKRSDHKRSEPRAAISGRATADKALEDAKAIDERYGLEPVFEPGEDTGSCDSGDGGGSGGDSRGGSNSERDGDATEVHTIECPYCGEPFEMLVDLSAGTANYIEDCRICCQPIEFDVEIDPTGRLVRLAAMRED